MASRAVARPATRSSDEDALCFAVGEMLRICLPDTVVWQHVPNEVLRIPKATPAIVAMMVRHNDRLSKMGRRNGWPDYEFIFEGRVFMIEAKDLGSLSKDQRDFRDDCARLGIPWALCRSAQSVWQQLHDWGLPIRKAAF